jgi:hypothetical protein
MRMHQETVLLAPTAAADRIQASVTDPHDGRRATSIKITRAIYLIFGLIGALLAIRFLLKALGADAGFTQLIYGVTVPLVAPFVRLFGTPQAASGAVLEVRTLIALVIYALVAWLLVTTAWLAFKDGQSASVARAETVQARAR